MFYNTYKKAVAIYSAFMPESKHDYEREAEMLRLLIECANNGYNDAGIAGKIFELAARPSTSRLITVQRNSARRQSVDVRYKVWDQTLSGEIKTCGGRVGGLYRLTPHQRDNTIVVYYATIEKTGRKNKPDFFDEVTVCMTATEFLGVLEETKGATHPVGHKGKNDTEPAIQMTLTVFNAFKKYDIGTFDRNNVSKYF